MSRSTFIKSLRITWTVCCGMACVLLIAMWVRGYRDYERFVVLGHHFIVDVNKRLCMFSTYPMKVPQLEMKPFFERRAYGIAVGVPVFLPIAVACAASIAPWVFYRFSLRTLLLAITLVAVVLGVVVWLIR
jgi:hypothetical protein